MIRCLAIVAIAAAGCGASTPRVTRVSYPNGTLRAETPLRDGLPDGVARTWYPNGQLRSQGPFVNGVRHGVFVYYKDNGAFDHQVMFWKDREVWRSTDRDAAPPGTLVHELQAQGGPIRIEGAGPSRGPFHFSTDPPAPNFASMDRIVKLDRVGAQVGAGSIDPMMLFATKVIGGYGVYGQLSEPVLDDAGGMMLGGRRTLELGGARFLDVGAAGTLALHAGGLAPIGNDDSYGYIAAAAGAMVRPGDAVASFPSSAALRTGATLVKQQRYLVFQADAGVDWLFGGQQSSVDALLRANAAVGFGFRSAMISLELANALRVSSPSRQLHAVSSGLTFWFAYGWVTGSVSYGTAGDTAIGLSVGYEL